MSPKAISKLLILDAEMEADRRFKLFRTIYMRRNGHRIAVYIARTISGYYASARLDNRGHSAWGKVPSHAVANVSKQLMWTIDRMTVEANFTKGVTNRSN